MKKPLVSVIMPVYNTAPFLSEAIESVLDQKYTNFELIIADDASTDGSWEIIQDYAKLDGRIVQMRNSYNLGSIATRNQALNRSEGKYIAWLDSDDIALPDRLERQVDFMEKNPEYGVCGSNIYQIDVLSNITRKVVFPATDKEIKKSIFYITPIRQSAVMIRRECLEKLGLFQLKFVEDTEICVKLGNEYKICNLQEFLVKYRVHGNNCILHNQKEIIANTLKLRKSAVRDYGYRMSVKARISYFVTWLMLFLPSHLVFYLFYFLREYTFNRSRTFVRQPMYDALEVRQVQVSDEYGI